jgi:hypothetical protein
MNRDTAAAAWSELHVHYVLRTAMQASRLADLQQLVLQRAARGALAPFTTDAAPVDRAAFLELGAEFLGGLAQIACRAREPAPRPALVNSACLDELTAYVARELNRQDLFDDSDALVEQFGRVYFRFLGGLSEVSAAAQERSLRALLAVDRDMPVCPARVELCAESGRTASTQLCIENTRTEPVTIAVRAVEVRRADGVGPAFSPKVNMQPAYLVVSANARASVQLDLEVTREHYEPGARYVGCLMVMQGAEPVIELPLTIEARTVERPQHHERQS